MPEGTQIVPGPDAGDGLISWQFKETPPDPYDGYVATAYSDPALVPVGFESSLEITVQTAVQGDDLGSFVGVAGDVDLTASDVKYVIEDPTVSAGVDPDLYPRVKLEKVALSNVVGASDTGHCTTAVFEVTILEATSYGNLLFYVRFPYRPGASGTAAVEGYVEVPLRTFYRLNVNAGVENIRRGQMPAKPNTGAVDTEVTDWIHGGPAPQVPQKVGTSAFRPLPRSPRGRYR